MGTLLYLPHGIQSSPYSHLLDPTLWLEIHDVFTKEACTLLGLSVDSPLSVWYIFTFILIHLYLLIIRGIQRIKMSRFVQLQYQRRMHCITCTIKYQTSHAAEASYRYMERQRRIARKYSKHVFMHTYLNICVQIRIKNAGLFPSADRDRLGKAEPLSFSFRLSHTQTTKHREQSANEIGLRSCHFPRCIE